VPEDAVDELYGLPLDEFTARRDELAKELRATGKRDRAAWVKALRKPSAAAWLLNQLAQTQKSDARRVLEKGDALRVAQERALARQASREELAGATQEHAEAMRTLLSKAQGAGVSRSSRRPAYRDHTRARGRDAPRDPFDDAVRAGFAVGRLTREHRAAGLGFVVSERTTVAPASPAKSAKPGKRPKGGASASAAKEVQRRAQQRARAQAVATEARSRHRARQREVSEAERDVRQAERELERAQRRLEKANQALVRAREREADAGKRVEGAEATAGRPWVG
jgi:hypothetical protein